jgi:hypothetical protein
MNFTEHYFIEKFSSADNFNTQYYKGYAEIFEDPTSSEVKSIMKDSSDHGVRLGITEKGKIYAWTEDIIHEDMENYLKIPFKVKLQYTRGHDTIWISSATKESDWKKYGEPKVDKLEKIFPLAKSVDYV